MPGTNLLTTPGRAFPPIIVHGAEIVAPAAGAIFATSPALNAGNYMVMVSFGGDDNVATVEVVHRNAANAADLELDYVGPPAPPNSFVTFFTVAALELIVARAKVAGTVAKNYQAALFIWPMP